MNPRASLLLRLVLLLYVCSTVTRACQVWPDGCPPGRTKELRNTRTERMETFSFPAGQTCATQTLESVCYDEYINCHNGDDYSRYISAWNDADAYSCKKEVFVSVSDFVGFVNRTEPCSTLVLDESYANRSGDEHCTWASFGPPVSICRLAGEPLVAETGNLTIREGAGFQCVETPPVDETLPPATIAPITPAPATLAPITSPPISSPPVTSPPSLGTYSPTSAPFFWATGAPMSSASISSFGAAQKWSSWSVSSLLLVAAV